MNQNSLQIRNSSHVLFVDMNSFFASCEQQVNYWLRGRPVGVCVYTGKFGCVIAPSVEAKKRGVKTGMRLNEAMVICPELVPLETNPARYRDFHKKIITVLKKYSNEVIPKSIDEAIVNLNGYELIYSDVAMVAKKIKQDIRNEVGDWLKCSIGIAPNAFLAKLASDVQKIDGLTVITPENIDEVLKKLRLKDLPGIASNMAERLQNAGINTPLELRYTSPERLRIICRGLSGEYWHQRLNFGEVDMNDNKDYKTMQAMRHLSKEQRKVVSGVNEIFLMLCMTLEKRMVEKNIFCKTIGFHARYESGYNYTDTINVSIPIQDGMVLIKALRERMGKFEKANKCEVINTDIILINIVVGDFINENAIQYDMFNDNSKQDKLRKTVYALKDKFGLNKLMRLAELNDHAPVKDVIGFGSVKDL